MPQFPIPAGKKVGNLVRLSPDESKHLSSVLRGQKGDRLTLFDGTHRFSGEIVSADPKKVVVRLVNQLDTPHLKGDVTLCQAMLKKDRMEWVVQKAVELGAARLIPFSSERTIPKEIGESKIGRWQKIADEAMKQCGRVTPMTIATLCNFNELIQTTEKDILEILFHDSRFSTLLGRVTAGLPLETVGDAAQGAAGRPASPELQRGEQDPPARNQNRLSKLYCFIGPEGGFSPKEVEAAKQAGCEIASLGSLTLRAETAAVAALTLIQHELGNI